MGQKSGGGALRLGSGSSRSRHRTEVHDAHSLRPYRLERRPPGRIWQVELTSSGVGTYDVSFPKRAADDADGTTSPEELVAAAHSACFAMQLWALIAEAGGTPQALQVEADVTLGPDEEAAEKARVGCPISKALAAVDITLEAALKG